MFSNLYGRISNMGNRKAVKYVAPIAFSTMGLFAMASGVAFGSSSSPEDDNPQYQPPKHTREKSVEALKEKTFDMLVIGGGATGTCVALVCHPSHQID